MKNVVSAPSKLASRSVCRFGEYLQICQCSQRCQGRWPGDVEASLDDSGGENRLLEREVNKLVGGASCRVLDSLAVSLSKVGQPLGSADSVDGLGGHCIEEH